MLNLLRMDIHRTFRGKSIYVCFLLLAFVNIIAFALLYSMVNPEIREFLLQHGATISINGNSTDMSAAISAIPILQLYAQTCMQGGFFAVTIGIFNSLFLCMDFESGFIKNILSSHESKWDYILSKISLFCIINFLYIAGTSLITLLLNILTGNYFGSSSLMDILFYLFSAWMLCNGFSALILLVNMLTRNKAAGVAAAIFLNGGFVVGLVGNLLGFMGLGWIMEYTLYMNLASLPTSFAGAYTVKPLLIGGLFFILYTVVSKIVLKKRDI